MALSVPTLTIRSTIVEEAYVRVRPVALSKTYLSFRVEVFADTPDDAAEMLDCHERAGAYDITSSSNPWHQAYAHLKADPTFAGATDR